MQNMTLANIAACLKSPLCQGDGKEAFEITGAVLDSRKVEPGFLFFPHFRFGQNKTPNCFGVFSVTAISCL